MNRRLSRTLAGLLLALAAAACCRPVMAAAPASRPAKADLPAQAPAKAEAPWSFIVLADPKPIGDTADEAGIQKSFGKDLMYLKATFLEKAEPNRPAPSFALVPGDFAPADVTDKTFALVLGADFPWLPVIGNHDLSSRPYMAKVLERYGKRLGIRLGPKDGPPGQYAFTFRNATFVAIDQYGRGGKAGEEDDATISARHADANDAAEANAPPADAGAPHQAPPRYAWAAEQLAASKSVYRIVAGHEPAWPFHAHTDDPLHAPPAERDRFWKMLAEANAQLYLCGHTHAYSTYRWLGNADPDRWQGYTSKIIPGPLGVWQVDAGRAAGPGHYQDRVLVYCKVTPECIEVETHVCARSGAGYGPWRVPPDGKLALHRFQVYPDLKANLPDDGPAKKSAAETVGHEAKSGPG